MLCAMNLRTAARSGDIDEIRKIIHSGLDVNCVSSTGVTALHIAAFAGKVCFQLCLSLSLTI